MSNNAPDLLQVENVSKAFPGVQALESVNLRVAAGEVVCVVGENGAGKSTLMKILGGVQQPDAGRILIDGQPARIASVDEAQRLGIVLIHQELNLAAGLDVAGNLFLGREPTIAGPLRIIRRRIYADAVHVMQQVGLTMSPRAAVGQLSIGQQQLVEIARALSLKSRVLIMDEPTSSLTQRDTEHLFRVIERLRGEGVSLLYISHRLGEVQAIADRAFVLRDGRSVGELRRGEITHDRLVRLMVGRELKQFFHRGERPVPAAGAAKATPSAPAVTPLRVCNLRFDGGGARPVSFELRSGEIVGMAGLMGAGRTELAQTLFGARRRLAGTVEVDGRLVNVRTPADAVRAGLLLVPEDRRIDGLLLDQSIRENVALPSLADLLSRWAIVARSRERDLAERMSRELGVRTPSIAQRAGLLSGGNQQKVVLAKWLCRRPRVLILDEPTRGIDVGAKAEIYALMGKLAADGVGVLMISSDLEEILGVCDRALVMHEGNLTGELERGDLSEQAVMQLATGGKVGV